MLSQQFEHYIRTINEETAMIESPLLQIVAFYADGHIDEDEAMTRLQHLGYNEDVARDIIDIGEAAKEQSAHGVCK